MDAFGNSFKQKLYTIVERLVRGGSFDIKGYSLLEFREGLDDGIVVSIRHSVHTFKRQKFTHIPGEKKKVLKHDWRALSEHHLVHWPILFA